MTTTNWRLAAACQGLAHLFDAEAGPDANTAKGYCLGCPVRTECLDAAMAEEVGDSTRRAGIRGGLNPKERSGLARQVRAKARAGTPASAPRPNTGGKPLAPCGTTTAYERHLRRKEPIDDACRAAGNAKRRASRAKAKSPVACGTRRGYQKHRRNGEPACDACRYANAAADRRLRTTGSTVAA